MSLLENSLVEEKLKRASTVEKLEKEGGGGMSLLEKYLRKTPKESQTKAAIAYLASLDVVHEAHPLIAQKIIDELKAQRTHLKLIASENFSSLAVQLAMGNLLTDKYAEGFPERRFYAGCENVDVIEKNACDELKNLFMCDHAYVQPHSGADANLVAFWSILIHRVQNKELEKLGGRTLDSLTKEEYEKVRQMMVNQKLMGMSLRSGGHLTHGYRHNVSSKFFQAVSYDVDPETHLIDYQALREQVHMEKPAILLAGFSAYSRKIDFAKMREIADEVGATLMVDMAHFSGLVAGKVFTGDFNPIPFAHIVTSTTHKTLRGPRGGLVLCKNEFREVVDKGCPIILGGPLPHVMAAKAIAFKEASTPAFVDYAHQIVKNAQALAEALSKKGVKITTGSTENHLMVLDVAASFGINGRQAELALREAKLTVNRNTVPFDPNGAWFTSGIRIGTPALTTLGMKEEEMREVADIMVTLLKSTKLSSFSDESERKKAAPIVEPKVLHEIQNRVKDLLVRFPLYPEIDIH